MVTELAPEWRTWSKAARTRLHSDRILFVDDEELACKAFQRILAGHGLSVDVATTAADATRLAASNAYAVIAVDYLIPNENGLALLQDLLRLQPAASGMVVSGQVHGNMQSVSSWQGQFYFVPKPWDGEQLCAVVRQAVDRYNSRLDEPPDNVEFES